MKIDKELMKKILYISSRDADFRLEEFKKYKNLAPDIKHYPFDKMKEIWPEGKFFVFGDVEGLYGDLEGKLVFIFRGTDALWDWIKNFIFIKKAIPYKNSGTNKKIKVHLGFYSSYLQVRDFIHKVIKDERNDRDVIFFGHSKGGALSEFAALDVQYNFGLDVGIFTIGCPAIGNKYFVESFNRRVKDYIRYTIENDPVPLVPPKIFFYEHPGIEHHFGGKNNFFKLSLKNHKWLRYEEKIYNEL